MNLFCGIVGVFASVEDPLFLIGDDVAFGLVWNPRRSVDEHVGSGRFLVETNLNSVIWNGNRDRQVEQFEYVPWSLRSGLVG